MTKAMQDEPTILEGSPASPLSSFQDQPSNPTSTYPKKNLKRKRLARLVSQEELGAEAVEEINIISEERSTSPPRSVSHFDRKSPTKDTSSNLIPMLPNPLDDPFLMKSHVCSLRLEARLHPMRLILTRLMSHQTHNRKGIFNAPVDAEALGLADYHRIVSRPMDLGTVKRRLHAVAYQSRQQVANDIRLVFTNSMRYNPPAHPVHMAAKELLTYFEQSIDGLRIKGSPEFTSGSHNEIEPLSPANISDRPKIIPRIVSTMEEEIVPSYGNDTDSPGKELASTSAAADVSKALDQQPIPVGVTQTGSLQPEVAQDVGRKKSKLPHFLPHSCRACNGRTCRICEQGCLLHEPALMVCQGVHCEGVKLRKGTSYYVSQDGHRHFCQKCYPSLPPVLPGTTDADPWRYKQDLLKRKNDEEITEKWLNCSKCSAGVHSICALHNEYVHDSLDYVCIDCQSRDGRIVQTITSVPSNGASDDRHTFVSGSDLPVSVESLGISIGKAVTADSLPVCAVSAFIQSKVGKRMQAVPNANKTVTVRVVSDSSKHFTVPDVVRRHFRMATAADGVVKPPSQVNYRQKAITLFQRIDGLDVCIFCMYVQEYDGDDEYESETTDIIRPSHNKRVYVAYIDSVEHFRPRQCRTEVYHEILVSYLATARVRGYETAHIWACPPSRGNSFVFWNHPSSQRTPNADRLISWYHGALNTAIVNGVVTDVKSLYESEFETYLKDLECSCQEDSKPGRMICPPLLDGDFWIEEAVRVHGASLSRNIKVRAPTEVCVWNVTPLSSNQLDPCPALQVATLIKDRVMTHPSSVSFRRPVNAAAMKLKNYHEVVTKPMDLGTVYAQCVIGEYDELRQVVQDVELMVENAKRFNPMGHFVHTKADEVRTLFYQELAALVQIWQRASADKDTRASWETFSNLSMSLDNTMDLSLLTSVKSTSVVIEDDRSSDGSRSLNSSVVSIPSSPLSAASLTKENEAGNATMAPQAPCLGKISRTTVKGKARGRGRKPTRKVKPSQPPNQLDLLNDGPDAVMQRMVGDDYWLLDKRKQTPPPSKPKTGVKRRRNSTSSNESVKSSVEEASTKRRRQSWVGEEVSEAVRRLRTSFFTCSLIPKRCMSEAEREKLSSFEEYVSEFDHDKNCLVSISSPICDARHALLEFSQYRHFEFDTLRRAKYSTAMLLYHLKNGDAPGVIPFCSSCSNAIKEVRWHKVKKLAEKRRATKSSKPVQMEPEFQQEELCGSCHSNHSEKDDFIPIPVSLKLG